MARLTLDSVRTQLQAHGGRGRAIKAGALAQELGAPADGRLVRSLVAELRRTGEPICSHPSCGYWWAESLADIEQAIAHLRGRAMESLKIVQHLRRHRAALAGQLNLEKCE